MKVTKATVKYYDNFYAWFIEIEHKKTTYRKVGGKNIDKEIVIAELKREIRESE